MARYCSIIADKTLYTIGHTVKKCYEILDGATERKISATCYGQQCWNMSRSLGCVRILPILLTLGRAFAQLQVYINIILTLACHTKLCGFNNKMLYF